VLLAVTAWMFDAGLLTALTQTVARCVIFFFASAGASAAYLTVSEIFPLEVRAKAIAVFFAVAQCFGAIGPVVYGALIGDGSDPGALFGGYLLGAGVMIVGGLIDRFLAVFTDSKAVLAGGVVLAGFFLGINNTLVTETVMKAVPVERGTASAAYSFVRFGGGAVAPLAGRGAGRDGQRAPAVLRRGGRRARLGRAARGRAGPARARRRRGGPGAGARPGGRRRGRLSAGPISAGRCAPSARARAGCPVPAGPGRPRRRRGCGAL
jgi:hypothetical protein